MLMTIYPGGGVIVTPADNPQFCGVADAGLAFKGPIVQRCWIIIAKLFTSCGVSGSSVR
jgi:hypothetical protein